MQCEVIDRCLVDHFYHISCCLHDDALYASLVVKEDIEQLRCAHSFVSQHLSCDTWRQLWQIPNIGKN